MKLQFASDLHLEFPENKDFIRSNPLKVAGEILVLAGDIALLNSLDQHKDFFDFVSDNFKQTYWVPGNHEYYHFDIAKRTGAFLEPIRSNVTLLNNQTIEVGDAQLHFSTLWSKISPNNAFYINWHLSDFHVINYEEQQLSVEQYNNMHADSVEFLQTAFKKNLEINKGSKKNIVVTHHVPTFRNYPEKYHGSVLNEAFATDLDQLVESSDAEYWIYGHHHAAKPDFKIGNTTMLTNQLGYVHQKEHKSFNKGRFISL